MPKWTAQDRTEITASDGTPARFVYDQEADILELFFGENEPATGVELTDHIVLRLNKQTRQAVSLILLHFSILTEHTEYGPRSYPLDKLNEVSEDLRELVFHVITSMPVNQCLKLKPAPTGLQTEVRKNVWLRNIQ